MKSISVMCITCVVIFTAAVGMPTAGAEVVYTQVNVTISGSGSIKINMNHDGTRDFVLQSASWPTTCGILGRGALMGSTKITPTTGNGIVVSQLGFAAVLASGISIDSSSTFYNAQSVIMQFFICSGGASKHLAGYLGLEFQINGQTHYGWAQVSIDAHDNYRGSGMSTTLVDFAYETIPGQAIKTGQTSGSLDNASTIPRSIQPVDYGDGSVAVAHKSTSNGSSGAAAEASNNDQQDRNSANGLIALSSSAVVDGNYVPFEIATMPKKGGPYHYITSLPNGANDPDFTPDGANIFFWSPTDNGPDVIFSVPAEGGALMQIPTGCSDDPNCLGDDNPAVSPNGRELLTLRALAPFDNNGCPVFVGIYRFRADGSHARQLSPSDAPSCAGDYEPRWSQDGHNIVFQHQDGTGLSSLWIMNRDGSHRHQVTPSGMDIGNPDLSPDGRRIVFQSPAEPADDQTPQQIYTIHPDGTHLVQLTHYAPEAGLTIKSYGTRWSPDGRKLVFAHVDSTTTIGPDGQHHADLFVMNPNGSHVVQIDFSPDRENGVAWGTRR